jgi:hypothetical protein
MSILSFFKKDKPEAPEISVTAARAAECLKLDEFKDYRASFEVMERKIIDELVMDAAGFSTQNESLERFAAKTLIKLTRIRDLRALLSKVQTDARKAEA